LLLFVDARGKIEKTRPIFLSPLGRVEKYQQEIPVIEGYSICSVDDHQPRYPTVVASDWRNAKEFAGKRAPGCIINSSNGGELDGLGLIYSMGILIN